MGPHAIGSAAPDQFARLHRLFVQHLATAIGTLWIATAAAAPYVPWLRNIRGLIDPAARVESTASFLLALPLVLTLAWIAVACGGDLMRRTTVLRNCAIEFMLAGLAAFAVFCMAVHRLAVAVSLVT